MRLFDCFVKPLAYTAYVVGISADNPVPISRVTTVIRNLLDESNNMALQNGFSQQEFEEARFAVCAWIDEAILCSDLPDSSQWMGELLQRKLYATTRAGDEFFQRMAGLHDTDRQVRDVYYHCLALEFKGRYFSPDMKEGLELIKKREYSTLANGDSMLVKSKLMGFFPEAYPPNSVPRIRRLFLSRISYVTLLSLLLPLILAVLTYISYSRHLGGMVENLIRLELK